MKIKLFEKSIVAVAFNFSLSTTLNINFTLCTTSHIKNYEIKNNANVRCMLKKKNLDNVNR